MKHRYHVRRSRLDLDTTSPPPVLNAGLGENLIPVARPTEHRRVRGNTTYYYYTIRTDRHSQCRQAIDPCDSVARRHTVRESSVQDKLMPVTLSISQRNGASYSGLSHSYMHTLLHTSSLTLCATNAGFPYHCSAHASVGHQEEVSAKNTLAWASACSRSRIEVTVEHTSKVASQRPDGPGNVVD